MINFLRGVKIAGFGVLSESRLFLSGVLFLWVVHVVCTHVVEYFVDKFPGFPFGHGEVVQEVVATVFWCGSRYFSFEVCYEFEGFFD